METNIIDKLIDVNSILVIEKISQYLQVKDLIAVSHTCRKWRDLTNVSINCI